MSTFISQPSFTIIGVQTRIQDPDTASDIIGAHWDSFFAEKILQKIPNAKNAQEIYAIYFDYDGAGGYSLLIGTVVADCKNIPHGMKCLTIPAQKYAQFCARGTIPSVVIETWQQIWQSDIKRTFTFDFEVYKDILKQQKEHTVDFYIAVR